MDSNGDSVQIFAKSAAVMSGNGVEEDATASAAAADGVMSHFDDRDGGGG